MEEVAIYGRIVVVLQKGIEIKRKKCYNVHSKQKNVFCNE